MRKVLIIVLLAGFLSCTVVSYGSETINWETSGSAAGTDFLFTDSGFTTPIIGHKTDPLIGGFVQLLFVGVDGYDGLGAQGTTGVLDDDEVIAVGHVGMNVTLGTKAAGAFGVGGSTHAQPNGSQFVIRFFTAPAANYGSGFIPESGSYGVADNGGGYFLSTSDLVDYFEITESLWADTPVVIPEPGTLLLGLLGMGVLAARRKRTK